MAISFAILEQSRVILSFVFVGYAGRVYCIVICINLPLTFVIADTVIYSALSAVCREMSSCSFSPDWSKFLYSWLWVQPTQTLSKHFSAWYGYTNVAIPYFFTSLKKWFATYFELALKLYNYAQFHCLDLDLWLVNFKICLKILSDWPPFVWSHTARSF